MFIYSTFERLLIKRFLFSKKTDGFISIFSWFSIIGIMIGVAAIIIVMAVMNGFREELTNRLLGINGHLNIYSKSNEITAKDLKDINDTDSSYTLQPITQTQAFLVANSNSKGVILRGYDKSYLDKKHFLNNLYQNEELRRSIAENAFKKASQLSWTKYQNEISKIVKI